MISAILNKNFIIKWSIGILLSAGAAILAVLFLKLAPFVILGIIFLFVLFLLVFKRPIFGIFLVAFLLPFERIGSFELSGITIRPSQVFVLITFFVWIIARIYRKNFKFIKNPLIFPLCLFLSFNLLSFYNAANLKRAAMVFIFTVFVITVSLIIPNMIRSKKNLGLIIKNILVSCLLVSLFGIFQFLGDVAGLPPSITGLREHYTSEVFGFPRIQSTALEPLYFANYLLIPISLCLALLLQKKANDKLNPVWLILILSVASLNLFLTLSRGGFLGLAAVIFLTGIIYFKSFFSFKKLFILILIGFVSFLGVYYFLNFAGKSKSIETFLKQATNFEKGVGVVERYQAYEKAYKLFLEHPYIGIGAGNFGPRVARHPLIMPEKGWLIVNNEFLEILTETGIFSLLIFLCLIFILIFRSIKAIKKTKDTYLKAALSGLFIAFCAILVQYQTFSILYILHIWFLIGLMIAAQNLILNQPKDFKKTA